MSKRITISIDEHLYSMIRVKHRNTSKYFQEIAKADIYSSEAETLYSGIVKRLKADGYIHEPRQRYTVVASNDNAIVTTDQLNDFQRAKQMAQLGVEPTVIPDMQ